jgi:dihydroxy-acid dehydratase
MLTGKYRGKDIGTSDVWRFNEAYKTGQMSADEFREAEACMGRSRGHCAVMGTASTMACMVEALGLSLPGNAAIPASDSRRKVLAHYSGMRIVEIVRENLRLSDILTREAFENAIKVNAAIGGSTNAVIHLLAMAGRIGVELDLNDFDVHSRGVPLLANLQPSGAFFMEDFYYAGGLPALMKEMGDLLHPAITVNGRPITDNALEFENYNKEVIGDLEKPINPMAGIVVVKGNLAENGAVIKASAASPELLKHRGRAVVFETIEDYHARVDDPNLNIDESCIMVLKSVGPKGYPGMPEVGNMALPTKLLEKGVKDMVRISDGRMSGTGFGTVVLHVSPESAAGGTLALVQDGDFIELDVENRSLNLEVSPEELAKRRAEWQAPTFESRGYVHLYQHHVTQSHLGADLDFLKGGSGSSVTRDSH